MSETMKTFTSPPLSTPTISPRLLTIGVSRNSSIPSTWPSAGPIARYAPSSALRAMPRPSVVRGAEEALGAAFRDPAVAEPHQLGVGRPARGTDELRPRTHRGANALWRAREQRRRIRAASSRTSARRSRRSPLVGRADQLRDPLLQRMRRVAIRMQRPAVGAGRRRASRRACPSSCARASRRAAPPAARSRDRRRSRRRARAPCARRRAAPARRGATRRRSRSRRRRGRRSPRRTGIAWIGFADERRKNASVARPTRRRRSSRRGRGASPRRRLPAARLP